FAIRFGVRLVLVDGLRLAPGGEQQIGARHAPLVPEPEIERFGATLLEQLPQFGLIVAREHRDWNGIPTERTQLPFIRWEIADRYAGVVLQDLDGVPEEEVADVGKVGTVEQVGRALDERVPSAEPIAEFLKTADLEAVVGNIGAEVIEGPDAGVCGGKRDLDAMGRVGHARSGRRIFRLRALRVELDQRDVLDRIAGAGEERIE